MTKCEASAQAGATATFARRLFRDLQQAIIRHESGAIAGQVEAIHDMRVGIRRLRVALRNFEACLPKEDRRRLRAILGHLADALGGTRDLDVMIGVLKSGQADKTEAERAVTSTFIRRLRARRRRRHRKLIGYLQGEEFANFKNEFRADDEDETWDREGAHDEQAA